MKKIIVDTNIVFSSLLNTSNKISDLLFNSKNCFQFYSCSLLKEEIENHKDKLLKLSSYSSEELNELINLLFPCLIFISEELISYDFWHHALPYVRDVDMDDIAFVALALCLDAELWTGDKKLLEGLRSKGFPNVLSTNELFELREMLDSK